MVPWLPDKPWGRAALHLRLEAADGYLELCLNLPNLWLRFLLLATEAPQRPGSPVLKLLYQL
jgi:hypothetical protein